MIPAPVRYARAADVAHAVELLGAPDAKALAGGQSLLSVMKLRIARPALVVDIGRLPLRGIEISDGDLHVGPLTTWAELETAPELRRPALAAITECAGEIGDLQVRNRGTIGGSLAHADPASDIPAALLAFGATLTLRSAGGERTVALDDFLLGPFLTTLDPAELVVDIVVPLPAPGSGSAYVSVEHPASGFALAGAAARVGPRGEVTVGMTGITSRPFLLPSDADVVDALAAVEILGDHFAPVEYRRALAGVVASRALERARVRAAEDPV